MEQVTAAQFTTSLKELFDAVDTAGTGSLDKAGHRQVAVNMKAKFMPNDPFNEERFEGMWAKMEGGEGQVSFDKLIVTMIPVLEAGGLIKSE